MSNVYYFYDVEFVYYPEWEDYERKIVKCLTIGTDFADAAERIKRCYGDVEDISFKLIDESEDGVMEISNEVREISNEI